MSKRMEEEFMKNMMGKAALIASIFLIAACSGGTETTEGAAPDKTAEAASAAASAPCTEETMMAKATELGEKMKGMASDPQAMQEMATKMQDIQAKVQQGTADGSFGIEQACLAYDELLAAS
jgi:hypothetical protein